VSDSYSSDTGPAEPDCTAPDGSSREPSLDLLAAGLLPPLPAAFLVGRDLDLLTPARFAADPLAAELTAPPLDRAELAAALASANAAYGHPAAAALGERLADPATLAIVTGQQPGLFGGPLYTLSKAVAAARIAERLSAAGRPAVAVFWVATEDHDFLESSRGAVLGSDGPREFDLGDDPEPLVPVGMRALGPAVEGVLAELRGANGGDRWSEWIDRLARWYRPEVRFGEAFCRLMTELLGARCPLLLDSMLPALKAAQRPGLARIVERRTAVAAAFAARDAAILERGHPLQVAPQPDASPLFLIQEGRRRRIEWTGDDGWRLRGEKGGSRPVAELQEIVEGNPAAVSPGVMARAVLQDAALGSALLVLGPGELSYLPQMAPLYELLEVEAPALYLRPQALVLGSHQLAKLEALDLGLEELTAPELDLERAVAAGREEDLVAAVRSGVERALGDLEARALEVDPTLEGPWRKTRHQIERALETFGGKVAGALARQNELTLRRARDLRDSCRPLGDLQERAISTAHFAGKYGEDLATALFEQLGDDPRRLHVIVPGRGEG